MKSAWLALAFFSFTSAAAPDGDGVLIGNGGDSIFCAQTDQGDKFPQDGFYVLDYAVSFRENVPLAKVRSLQLSFDRIENLLSLKAPEVVESFRDFRAAIKDVPKETATRKWIGSEVPLKNIKDENARLLPKNCRFQSPNQKFFGIYQQTVIRKNKGSHIEYVYDSEYVADYLGREDATQASVLFIHEWLWDYYDHDPKSAPKIRSANAFLHSLAADSAESTSFRNRVFRATAANP